MLRNAKGFQRLTYAITLLTVTGLSYAQDSLRAPEDISMPQKQYVVDLGLGVIAKPKYEGADETHAYPLPIFAMGRFYLPPIGQILEGQPTKRGVFFFASFDFKGEREASDDDSLIGTEAIDWAIEMGPGIGYRYDWLRGFVELRQGFNGHTGQVGQLGADFIFSPRERLQFSMGPRAGFASGKYMDTYFGVSSREAADSDGRLTTYDPGGGFKTLGLVGRVSYALNDQTSLHLQGRWDRFIGDAKDSPIVRYGDDDQFSIGVGVTYRFAFDLFD